MRLSNYNYPMGFVSIDVGRTPISPHMGKLESVRERHSEDAQSEAQLPRAARATSTDGTAAGAEPAGGTPATSDAGAAPAAPIRTSQSQRWRTLALAPLHESLPARLPENEAVLDPAPPTPAAPGPSAEEERAEQEFSTVALSTLLIASKRNITYYLGRTELKVGTTWAGRSSRQRGRRGGRVWVRVGGAMGGVDVVSGYFV